MDLMGRLKSGIRADIDKHFDKTIENHMRDGSLGKSNEVDIYNF